MGSQRAIRHHAFGDPAEVLRLETLDVPEPGQGEVRVRFLAGPVNPSDLGMIGGSYGRLRELPAVAGREGVGVVEALGPGVSGVGEGEHVAFPGENGAWREYACAAVEGLRKVPPEVPVEQAAMSFVNPPTAYCLLREVVNLEPGDWVLQNAGNSAVGLSVIRMARAMGLRTISQVRREELVEPLREMGADHVVLEGGDWFKNVGDLTGGASVRLALNSVGGQSAADQLKALGEGAAQVTFGAMTGEKVRFPTRFLIFNDVRLVGFWWDRWQRRNGEEAVRGVLGEVHGMMARGELSLPVAARYPLSEFRQALEANAQPRLGKVLLVPDARER